MERPGRQRSTCGGGSAHLIEALLRPFPPVRPAARLARELGTGGLLRFARRATLSARHLGNERFAGRGAHAIIAGNAMHTDLGPDDSASGLFGWLLALLAQDVGFRSLKAEPGR